MDTVELLVQVGSLAALAVAIWGLRQNSKIHERQSNAQTFIEYTGRYERVMSDFPPDAFDARLNTAAALPEPSAALSLVALRYLNLCSEEYYLWRERYLSDSVWSIWEVELKRTLRTPLMRREWVRLRPEFASYPEFSEFVDAVQNAE